MENKTIVEIMQQISLKPNTAQFKYSAQTISTVAWNGEILDISYNKLEKK